MRSAIDSSRPHIPSLLTLVLAVGLSGCSHGQPPLNSVDGYIGPEYFRFREIVKAPRNADKPGGWRAVCIHAQINSGDSGATTVCKFEVGVPIRPKDQGEIRLEEAQFAAAAMANRAARDVLGSAHPGTMLAELCNRFKQTYELMLNTKFSGAKVGACMTEGTETVLFGVSIPKRSERND